MLVWVVVWVEDALLVRDEVTVLVPVEVGVMVPVEVADVVVLEVKVEEGVDDGEVVRLVVAVSV